MLKRLSKADILRALQELETELVPSPAQRTLVIAGGAALVALYDARESTRDVDAVVLDREIREAAVVVAAKLDLPADWLNDGAKGYLQGLALGETILTSAKLVVRTLAIEQLLAMKLSAWRDDVDISDARLLLDKIKGEREHVWTLVERYLMPGRHLKAQYAFADLWETSRERS